MIIEQAQKLRSITLTNGNIKELASECEVLKIRGSVALYQEVRLKEISTHGHSSFHAHVIADVLKNTGSCVIKDRCEVKEISNAGNLKMRTVQTTKITSTGKLTIEQILHAEQFDSIGFVLAKEIQANHFQLKLSGESKIERLITDEACVEKDKISLSLFKKKLTCKYIKGKNLQLSYTDAEIVEGDVVAIGKNCHIQTLYYKESYTISPDAKVQHIIRSEKE
ncbi:hypothetical protein [Cytobacillus dafuensis]|uniref:DUF342 domain-containing protein n=1 Tax=Cytobacillus dafuensis TaxID=1742359 RepID=A0A5B8ZA66_CYTDA|nr:hypothetical protein [Cytobacillus dafuensis]QED49878.1 hypothetical protein FSZ17_22810 [Cytobacillus dafuensis]